MILDLKETLQDKETKIENLNERYILLENTQVEQIKELTLNESEIKHLKESMDFKLKKLNEVKEELNTKESKLDIEQQEKEELESKNNELRTKIEKLTTKNAELVSKLNDIDEEYTIINNDLKEIKSKTNNKDTLDNKDSIINELDAELGRLKEENINLKENNEELMIEIENLDSYKQEKIKIINEMNVKYRNLVQNNDDLKTQFDDSLLTKTNELKTSKSLCKTHEDTIHILKSKIDSKSLELVNLNNHKFELERIIVENENKLNMSELLIKELKNGKEVLEREKTELLNFLYSLC